jgi:hypothetical protein
VVLTSAGSGVRGQLPSNGGQAITYTTDQTVADLLRELIRKIDAGNLPNRRINGNSMTGLLDRQSPGR